MPLLFIGQKMRACNLPRPSRVSSNRGLLGAWSIGPVFGGAGRNLQLRGDTCDSAECCSSNKFKRGVVNV